MTFYNKFKLELMAYIAGIIATATISTISLAAIIWLSIIAAPILWPLLAAGIFAGTLGILALYGWSCWKHKTWRFFSELKQLRELQQQQEQPTALVY